MKMPRSRFQFEIFFLAFLVSFMFMWFTLIVKKDYVVFTDPDAVPESTDFFAGLIGSSEEEEE